VNVLWAILCNSSSVDRDSNTISLFNVIEELQLAAPPPEVDDQPAGLPEIGDQPGAAPANVLYGPMELVILFVRTESEVPERHVARVDIRPPDSQVTARTGTFEVDLSHFKRLRHRSHLPGIPMATEGSVEGTYTFRIELRAEDDSWQSAYEFPLEVSVSALDQVN
jgi:hypothetical protein